ncbi:hypothetical protein BKA56DRAFT_555751 [Ilyonectria sp. MPI-CAGE-AT-0026]|nr:hypothetical protein BKA56DRAFT_555751 [Ilyonectria sp. MPI-CAGE-AT-0026]
MVDRPRTSSTTSTFRRAAIACQSCRLRKVKCDAQSVPSDEGCGPCQRAGQECLLDPLSDGRRSVSRKFVDKLQQRIETLEALNQRTGDTSTCRPTEDATVPLTDASVPSFGPSAAPPNTALPQGDDSTDPVVTRVSYSSHQTLPASTLINGTSPEKTRDESPSFFGATSHPHVVSPGDESRLNSFEESDGVDIDLDPSSPHLREHLLQSFFKYQSLWVDIVGKEQFMTHQATGNQSRWYSKFLENAMLACGTRLSTSKSVRALGSKYCEWAKDEALKAMSEPTPSNLQGFLVLSEYEVTQGNLRPGWMFCGVACRMLSDLGLHELASNMGAQEPTKGSDVAYALLSACVVYEGVWTLYLGRPSSIPRSVMSIAASRCKAGRKSDSPWLNAWVRLCVPMAEISQVLNEHSIDNSDRTASLRKLFGQVEEWYESLPPELTYNENRLTNMDLAGYGLHTQYCKVQILLRRALAKPSISRKRRHSQITGDSAIRTSSDDSEVIIYQYALRVARLVVTYREAFGMEKIPSIMLDNAVVAATAMIEHLNKAENVNEIQRQTTWLRQLVKSMESVQPHFPIVGRMLESLKQICGGGLLSIMFPSTHWDLTEGPSQEASASNPLPELNSGSNLTQDDSFVAGSGPDFWDCFDTEITRGGFASGGFDSSLLDLLPSEVLISGLAQTLP